ncbi:MAG: hypothetical protein ACODAF_05770 [Actinomycetota bacterium]
MPEPTGVAWLDYAVIYPAIVLVALGVLYRPVRGLVRMVRWSYRLARETERFLSDWFGDGDQRPGVMARLEAVEAADVALQARVGGLEEATSAQTDHIDQLCEGLRDQVRSERAAVLADHLRKHHGQPQGDTA